MMKEERIALVTGGSGFIGESLIKRLVTEGWTIQNLDFAPGRFLHPRVRHWSGSFQDNQLLREAMVGVDTVWHLASTHFPRDADQNPYGDAEGAILGTLSIAEMARELGVRRLVYASSGGTVYGELATASVAEDHPTRPITAYGISKLASEHYLRLFNGRGLSTISLRIANPYGPGQNILKAQGALTTFCHHAATGLPITIWGDGSVERDFVHVDDVARALILAADANASGTEINIGSGCGVSLNQLLDLIRAARDDLSIDVSYEASRSFDVPRSVLAIDRARDLLGWQPEIPLATGISQVLSAFRKADDATPRDEWQSPTEVTTVGLATTSIKEPQSSTPQPVRSGLDLHVR